MSLKDGDRSQKKEPNEEEVGPFEDDYEDEYESEDDIMVAGADGEPDAEEPGKAEELGGM